MFLSKSLKPVEKLVLMGKSNEEDVKLSDLVIATLANLYYNDKVQYYEKKFFVSGTHNEYILRTYEEELMDCLEDEDYRGMKSSLKNFDFNELLAHQGFLICDETREFNLNFEKSNLRIFHNYFWSKKGVEAVDELINFRKLIDNQIENDALDNFIISQSYAFPSLELETEIHRYVSDIRLTQINKNIVTIASAAVIGSIFMYLI